MRCYRKILRISYEDHVTNEEVSAKIQRVIGPHEDLLTIIKRCNLQWYGHVSRSSALAKTILQGTVKGERRQGRQRKRLEDIREWTGLEFAKSQRAVENREKWKKLVAKSSVVLQRPSWLTFLVLGSQPYVSLTVGEFLAHTFHIGDSLFILLIVWASYSPRGGTGLLAAQPLTMTPKTKHSPAKRHRANNPVYNQCP